MIWTNNRSLKVGNENTQSKTIPHVELAQFVQVRGALQWKDQKPVIVVNSVQHDHDPHAELLWWIQLERIHESVYSKPFPIEGRIQKSSESTPFSE